jgi:hypothetical protein
MRTGLMAALALMLGCGDDASTPTCAPVNHLTQVEYLAEVEDGRTIVVTRPIEDADYEDFRLFLGVAPDLLEREVFQVSRFSDGGTTIIEFDVDATVHVLELSATGAGTLNTGEEVLDVQWTVEPGNDAAADLELVCLE